MVAAASAIDREAARDLVVDELSRPEYRRDDPSLVERAGRWIVERVTDLLDAASGATPGGWLGIAILVAAAMLAAAVVLGRVGGVRRTARSEQALLAGRLRTAQEHRALADAAAAQGRYDEAVRERLRAVARELEERGLLEPRPGRTADELVREADAVLPGTADALRAAARVFDDVWYGGRVADARSDATVRHADDLVHRSRPPIGTPA